MANTVVTGYMPQQQNEATVPAVATPTPEQQASSPTTSPPSDEPVVICTPRSPNTDSATLDQSRDARSTYHVYHKKENHAVLSPSPIPSKDRFWGPCISVNREKRRLRKQKKLLEAQELKEGLAISIITEVADDSTSNSPTCDPADEGAFFLHTPYLAFKDPPRVLYAGRTKHAKPVALVHGSLFWRKWKLQLGPTISEPGVLDRRGVVAWRHNGGSEKVAQARDGESTSDDSDRASTLTGSSKIKSTLLYQVIVSTAMCMVIGEAQKRKTIRKIIELILLEGAGGAST